VSLPVFVTCIGVPNSRVIERVRSIAEETGADLWIDPGYPLIGPLNPVTSHELGVRPVGLALVDHPDELGPSATTPSRALKTRQVTNKLRAVMAVLGEQPLAGSRWVNEFPFPQLVVGHPTNKGRWAGLLRDLLAPPLALDLAQEEDPVYILTQARVLYHRGQIEHALERVLLLTRRNTTLQGMWACLAVMYAALERWTDCEQASQISVESGDDRVVSFCYLGLARAASGRHAEALPAFQRALSIYQSYRRAWVGTGVSLQALGRNEEAIQALEVALRIGMDTPWAYEDLGLIATAKQHLSELRVGGP
jgi:tetratricopeptide (TPR) repeat protein